MQTNISIRFPDDLRDDLDRFAETRGMSRGDVVRAAVQEYLFVRRFHELRRELMPYAEAQGIYYDEDVFRAS